jgi:predicted DsbA family dithiol-disulfide isomerase
MGGLIPSWKFYQDSLNAVARPIQMGPVWMEAGHLTGMPNQSSIWMTQPPASSYLSCIAVKCAALQSAAAGEVYLRKLREAVMLEGRHIAVQSVLTDIARAVALEHPDLDEDLFLFDLSTGKGKDAFNKDLNEVQQMQIHRFPTLIFRRVGMPSLMLSGHKPYVKLLEVMQQLAPEHSPRKLDPMDEDFIRHWQGAMPREMAEVSINPTSPPAQS